MKSTVAWMLLAILNSTACAPSGPAVEVRPDSFCLIAKPIYFDPADRMTRQTERAIIAHNEKGAGLCGWK